MQDWGALGQKKTGEQKRKGGKAGAVGVGKEHEGKQHEGKRHRGRGGGGGGREGQFWKVCGRGQQQGS